MTVIELEQEIQAEEKLSDELEQYSGKWVAVRDHHVVASASSLKELREQVEGEVEGVFRVPEGEAACFF